MALRRAVQRVLPEPVKGRAGTALGRVMDACAVPLPGPRAGRAASPAVRSAPSVLVLLLSPGSVDVVADTVEDLARFTAEPGAAVRPVLVLDGANFALARRAGLPVDHVLAREDWQRRHPGTPYAQHLAERLAGLCRDYATRQFVTLPPGGSRALPDGELAALLVPLAGGAMRRRLRRAAGRLEAVLDRPTSGA